MKIWDKAVTSITTVEMYLHFRWPACCSESSWLEVSKAEKLGLRIFSFENMAKVPANLKFTVLGP